jgi:hypothetical protein
VDDLFRVGGLHVAHEKKTRQQLSIFIGDRKIFLVLLHADDEAFLRHLEKRLIETAGERHGIFDEAGDFVYQFRRLAQIPVGARGDLPGFRVQRLGDRLAPRLKRSKYLTRLFQDFSSPLSVIVIRPLPNGGRESYCCS